MENKLVSGGQTLEQKEREKQKAYREFQLKLRKQKKKEKHLIEEKKRQEDEMLMVENQYQSLQEEVDANRKIIKKLRTKYKQHESEINDLKSEH